MTTLHDSAPEKFPAERKSTGGEQSPRDVTEVPISSSSGPSSLVPESLSSASSFQSLASTVSSKSSSGICADSAPGSPDKTTSGFDHSYVNVDIPELDDLISACANINIGSANKGYINPNESSDSSGDLSQDQTFASAADDTLAGDETQIHVEESIQTFKTCPGLEVTHTQKVASSISICKTSLPVDEQSVESSTSSSSSVIPYLSFEESVLKKVKTGGDSSNEQFESATNTLQVTNETSSGHHSLTHCEGTDIAVLGIEAQVNIGDRVIVSTNQEETVSSLRTVVQEFKIQENVFVDSPDVSFQEVQTFNSTVVLNNEPASEESNLTAVKTSLQLNSTFSRDTNVVGTPDKCEVVTSETINLNKTGTITEEYPLNKSQEIVHESILNKTQDIIQGNVLNKTLDIEQKEILFNKTQELTDEKITLSEINNAIFEGNRLNETQNIKKKDNILNKTQDILQENNNFSNTEIIFPGKQIRNSDEVQNLKTEIDINVNEVKKVEESWLQVKTPSKLFAPKETFAVPTQNLFNVEAQNANSLKTQIIASTPLHEKNSSKVEAQKTPKRKSVLFAENIQSLKPESPELTKENINHLNKVEIKQELISKYSDHTLEVNKSLEKSSFSATELISKDNLEITNNLLADVSLNLLPTQEPDYEAFKPQTQSTSLPERCPDFEVLQEAALSVAKDIDASIEKIEESEQFVSATTELFEDPSAFDFLTQAGSKTSKRGERYDSLYMKFDPLAQRLSMLPQKNSPAASPSVAEEEEKDFKTDTPISNIDTPKKNPALAAIDRLLFYSPCAPTPAESKVVEVQEKKEVVEKPEEPQIVPVVDEKIAKELELVRSTVLQLEAELEKETKEHQTKAEDWEKQRAAYDEKMNQLQSKFGQMQSQLTQEVKCKDQMTVVVEEYEKSISRLIAEREKDRTSFEAEKAKLSEELQVATQHLSNTEAAFSDVHTKYERLKNVVSAYKSNEALLKESIAENQETIKTLENRYEQLKSHAMAQLEKANLELSAIRKQHEAELIKLKAQVRKSELKTKSLEETVEQKIKENKELTQIIDEMIARVE